MRLSFCKVKCLCHHEYLSHCCCFRPYQWHQLQPPCLKWSSKTRGWPIFLGPSRSLLYRPCLITGCSLPRVLQRCPGRLWYTCRCPCRWPPWSPSWSPRVWTLSPRSWRSPSIQSSKLKVSLWTKTRRLRRNRQTYWTNFSRITKNVVRRRTKTRTEAPSSYPMSEEHFFKYEMNIFTFTFNFFPSGASAYWPFCVTWLPQILSIMKPLRSNLSNLPR